MNILTYNITMTEERIKMIKHDLSSLEPTKINIEDEGHLHIGHAGAKTGGIPGHLDRGVPRPRLYG